ncbi:MAG: prepilin-type N-terminal cleavage/methylation domain-containing protein [Planctomycetia bacterium]|nr:prepilin-type N-terminal cleavage/methylation domain-containing protein [Planctomycetia bacterium]
MRTRTLNLDSRGFTLVEITVVLAILGLVTSLAVVNYREPVNNVRLENIFEQVTHFEQRMRHWCRTHNTPAQIKVDLDRGEFAAQLRDGTKLDIPEVKITEGFKLKELRVMGENRFGRDTIIPYTSEGIAPCWALSIAYSGQRERYRLIIGMTGQSISFQSEDELRRFERESQLSGSVLGQLPLVPSLMVDARLSDTNLPFGDWEVD